MEIEYTLTGAVEDYGMFTELGKPQFMLWLCQLAQANSHGPRPNVP